MNSLKEIQSLRNKSSQHGVSPSPEAWHRLENRLKEHKYQSKIHLYKTMMIAAVSILLITVTIVISTVFMDNKENLITELNNYQASELDITDIQEAALYSRKNVTELREAYARIGFNNKSESTLIN